MILVEHQRLPTSGARAVLPYVIAGARYLVIPQLSKDVENTPAHMNGGDSDTGAPVFKWSAGRFVEHGRLPLSGVKVLDFMWVLAGPGVTRAMADYGATVVRIESVERVDPTRTVGPFKDNNTNAEYSALFQLLGTTYGGNGEATS